jgi:hypothetical protein
MVELKHEADAPVAERDHVGVAHRGQLEAVQGDAALIDTIQSAKHVQQGALADAGRADDRDHLSRLDRQIEIAQHGQRLTADRIALDDAAGF